MSRSPLLVAFATLLGLGIVSGPALATPRYSLEAGQNCTLCHQNPSGGGMRSAYATQYLIPERFALRAPARLPDPQIGADLSVGADARTFFLWQEDRTSGGDFVQMAASVYGWFQLGDRAGGYANLEFGQGESYAAEIFGVAWVLPGAGYVKAGRFVPAFGWRVPDHRAFVRREFTWLPPFPPHSDTGLEIGFHPKRFQIQASLTNGEYRLARDGNDELAFTARGAWLPTFGSVHVTVGGSWHQNRGVVEDRYAGGGFAGASWRRVTWLGEFDWSRSEPAPPDRIRNRFTVSQELAIRIVQGVHALGSYDFHDPDLDVAGGALHRIGVGAEALLTPFVQVRAKLNAFRVDDGPDALRLGLRNDFLQSEFEVHWLY
ncbi:MAG: hypothetical protein R3B81_12660 [bacterium]